MIAPTPLSPLGGPTRLLALAACVLMLTTGCPPSNEFVPPPPPTVTVAKPLVETVTNYLEETGTTEAVDKVEIRARVRGFLEQINFTQGDEVIADNGDPEKDDDVLYVIEQQLYVANVNKAKAAVAVARAEYENARARYQRAIPLAQKDAISREELEERRAESSVAMSKIYAAEAELREAQINLDYTEITSPISGRIGKTLVKLGNLVDGSEATHLATVIKYDPIYANFNISERDLLQILEETPSEEDKQNDRRLRAILRAIVEFRQANDGNWPDDLEQVRKYVKGNFGGELMTNPVTGDDPGYEYVKPQPDSDGNVEPRTIILYQLRGGSRVEDPDELAVGYANGHHSGERKIFLKRANDEGFPFQGYFDYADLAVDQSTGTFLVRAIFDNTDLQILPGLFVRLRVPIGQVEDALLVPSVAVASDQQGPYVFVVNSEDEVERRNVRLGAQLGEMQVVLKGLRAEDSVIIAGVQRARVGAKVNANSTTLPPLKTDGVQAIAGAGKEPPEGPASEFDESLAPMFEEETDAADDSPASP